MCRSDRREPIFQNNLDCRRFLEAPGEDCAKTAWRVGEHRYGPERAKSAVSAEERAARMVEQELARAG